MHARAARKLPSTLQTCRPAALRAIAKRARAAAAASLALVDSVVETLEDAEDVKDALEVRSRIARGQERISTFAQARRKLRI